MAVKTYRAIEKGYIDGRMIAVGEVFAHEFTEVQREEKQPGELAGKIKRNKEGEAIVKPCGAPNWAVEVGKAEAAAAAAADPVRGDPNYEALPLPALQAIAAEKRVPFDGLEKKDLIAAIKAVKEPTA